MSHLNNPRSNGCSYGKSYYKYTVYIEQYQQITLKSLFPLAFPSNYGYKTIAPCYYEYTVPSKHKICKEILIRILQTKIRLYVYSRFYNSNAEEE